MKDIHAPLRALYFSLITAKGYTCYEDGATPDNAVTPYVIIADMQGREDSNKSDFGNVFQVLLDVVTSYPKTKAAGSLQVDSMAGVLLENINSRIKMEMLDTDTNVFEFTFPFTFSTEIGLQIVNTKVLQDKKITMNTSTHKIYRRLLRFQHLIMEV